VVRGRPRAAVLLPLLVAVGVFAYQLAFPPSLGVADETYTLYGAKRVLEGQAPYRDFFDFITPLSFYYFALAYVLGGVTLAAARTAMAAANAISGALVFVLARRVAGVPEAGLAALGFATGCLPVWQVVSQHWLSTTLCLATAAMLLSERWRASRRLRPAAVGVLCGLAVCNEQERGAALALWLALAIPAIAWGEGRRPGRELVWAAGAGGVATLGILGHAAWRSSLAAVVDATVVFVLTGYRRTNVGKVAWGGANLLAWTFRSFALSWLATGIPVALAVEAVAIGAALRRRKRVETTRLVLLLLAVLMSVSVLYYPDFIHLAFVAPFSFVVAAGLVHRVRTAPLTRTRLGWGMGALALVVCAAAAVVQGERSLALSRARAPERFRSAFGELAGDASTRTMLEAAQAAVAFVPAKSRTLYSYPADCWFHLTLPASDPLPFCLLMRGYNTPAQLRAAQDALERRLPDFVIVNFLMVKPGDPMIAVVRRGYRELRGLSYVQVLYARKAEEETGSP